MNSFESATLTYIVNSTWQVPLFAAATWFMARAIGGLGTRLQHRVWVLSLFASVVVPACTFRPAALGLAVMHLLEPRAAAMRQAHITTTIHASYASGFFHLSPRQTAAILTLYAAISFFFVVRLIAGLFTIRRLRRGSIAVELSAAKRETWNRCRRQFHTEQAALAFSPVANAPMTIGVLRPLVLMPAGWQADLPEDDFAAVVTHESAHIQRRDFLKNLAYHAITLPIAYHPLRFFLLNRISATREIVCDESAADFLNNKQLYAHSLLRVASLLASGRRSQTAHAIGILDANNLEARIMKLTLKSVEVKSIRRFTSFTACALLGLGTGAFALSYRIDATAPVAKAQAEGPSGALKVSGGVMAGNSLTKVAPVYPPDAKAAGITGSVVLHAIIGRDGAVERLTVVSGPKELLGSAIDAVKQWTYKPFLLNGEPTEVDTTITVNYSLQ